MFDQAVFNFAGPYAVTGRFKYIVSATLVPEVALSVAGGQVTGAAPVACVFARAGFGLVPIAEKENRVGVAVHIETMQSHVASHANFTFLAIVINHRHTVPGIGAAHAARPCRPTHAVSGVTIHGAVADDVIHLGLAKHLIHRHAQFIAAVSKHRVAHSFAGAHDGLHIQLKLRRRMRVGLHHGFQGRGK